MPELELSNKNIAQAEIHELEKAYSFKNKEKVLNFINQHPSLMPLLIEAPGKIVKYFADTPLSLEVQFDPEIADLITLLVWIETKLEPEEALAKLDQLDEEWWLDASDPLDDTILMV